MNKLWLLLVTLCFVGVAQAVITTPNNFYTWNGGSFTDSLNALNGTNNGTTNTVGKIAQARYYDGNGQSIQVNNNGSVTTTSYSMWANFSSITGTDSIFSYFNGTEAVTNGYIFYSSGGVLTIFANNVAYATNVNVTAGQWYHIVLVRVGNGSGPSGRTLVYLNNTLALNTTSAPSARGQAAPLRFGYSGGGIGMFHGGLDAFGIWNNYQLSTAEVSELWNGGLGAEYPFSRNFTITASENGTSTTLTTFNATVNDTNYNTSTGIIQTGIESNRTVNISVSAYQYFNATYNNYNLSASLSSVLIRWTAIRVVPIGTTNMLYNFSVNYTNNANTSISGTAVATNGIAYIPLYNGTYSVTVYDINNNGSRYAQTTENLTAAPYYTNHTFSVYTSESILFSFYDETTGVLLSTTNVSAFLTSSVRSYNITTTNGTYFIDLVSPATYIITYNASGYGQREYVYTVTNQSTTTLSLYLLSSSLDDLVLNTVFDTQARKVQGAIIKMQKKNLTGTNYYIVEMCTTNILGECLLHVNLYDTTYRFLIDYDGETKLNSNDTKVSANTLSFIINLRASLLTQYYELNSISYSLTNGTNSFIFVWNDAYGNTQTGCLQTIRRDGSALTVYNNSCSSSASGTITQTFNNATGDEWIGIAYIITEDGSNFVLSSLSIVTSEFKAQFGRNGLYLFGFIVLGTMAFSGLIHPILPIVLIVMGMFVMNGLGFVSVGTTAVVSLLGIAVIYIIALKRT